VGSAERIRNVAQRVAKWRTAGHDIVVVPSAMAGETNRLLALAAELQEHPEPRELDVVAATGEQVTAGLLAMALMESGTPARSYTGWQVAVRTDSAHTKARIVSIDETRIRQDLASGRVVVVAGFQGVDAEGNVTTLGRGGSDTSAVALAAALKADECQIYTDVDGVYTADPRIVPEARRLLTVTFEEMLEMASAGSKVLQIRSVEFAGKYKVPTRVLSSLTDPMLPVAEEARAGTLITFEEDPHMAMEKALVSGVAAQRDEAKITVHSVPDKPGIAYAILGPIADANINVDVIVQNVSHDGMTDLSFTVNRGDLPRAMKILKDQVKPHIGCKDVTGDDRMAKVSIVGVGMRSHAGIAAQMFRTLAEEGINIQMISTSEIKISVVVDEKYAELAVRVLHKAFELEKR
jgi:aspartate kinase